MGFILSDYICFCLAGVEGFCFLFSLKMEEAAIFYKSLLWLYRTKVKRYACPNHKRYTSSSCFCQSNGLFG